MDLFSECCAEWADRNNSRLAIERTCGGWVAHFSLRDSVGAFKASVWHSGKRMIRRADEAGVIRLRTETEEEFRERLNKDIALAVVQARKDRMRALTRRPVAAAAA